MEDLNQGGLWTALAATTTALIAAVVKVRVSGDRRKPSGDKLVEAESAFAMQQAQAREKFRESLQHEFSELMGSYRVKVDEAAALAGRVEFLESQLESLRAEHQACNRRISALEKSLKARKPRKKPR